MSGLSLSAYASIFGLHGVLGVLVIVVIAFGALAVFDSMDDGGDV